MSQEGKNKKRFKLRLVKRTRANVVLLPVVSCRRAANNKKKTPSSGTRGKCHLRGASVALYRDTTVYRPLPNGYNYRPLLPRPTDRATREGCRRRRRRTPVSSYTPAGRVAFLMPRSSSSCARTPVRQLVPSPGTRKTRPERVLYSFVHSFGI